MKVRRLLWWAAGLMAVVLTSRADPAPTWRADLLAHARVEGRHVRLGDIARLEGADADRVQAAAMLDLGTAPRFGEELRLDRSRVAAWLVRAAPQLPPMAWGGADTVRISRAGRSIRAADVCRAAEDSVVATVAVPASTRVRAAADCPDKDWTVPVGEQTDLRARAPVDGAWPVRRIAVQVELWSDGRYVRTAMVPVRVQVLGTAWVARNDISPRRTVDRDAFDAVEIDLAGLAAPPLALDATFEALRLRRAVLKGQVLTNAHVESQPAVSRGKRVTVRSRAGAISLEAPAEALQDGRPGEHVLVRMGGHAGASLLARVVGPNQVQLQP
jgi:flagellar basal body P-ring formation protein FlgA